MAKYLYTHGKRKGVVYQEFYCVVNGQSMVQKRNLYCPVNTKWLSRVEFREYILQVIKGYYPNYLVVSELPEQLEDHIIYFLETVHEGEDIYYDIYVYDHEIKKQIKINCVSPGDLLPILEFIDTVKTNSLKNVYNTKLTADRLIYSDNNGYIAASDLAKSTTKTVVDNIPTKSLKNVYNATLTGYRVIASDKNGYMYASNINSNTAATVITGMTSGCLKDNYSNLLPTEKVVITNTSGTIEASDINKNTAATVVTGVSTKSLKNIYNTTLTADRLIYSDSNGCLAISDVTKTNAKSVIDGVKNKFLSATYNTNLTANKILGSNSSGKLYATGIESSTASNVINGISTKSFKEVYNTTLAANRLLCTDAAGYVGTMAKYTLPHLYIHKFHQDNGGTGEVNFVIYSTKSDKYKTTDIYNFLQSVGADVYYRAYPANGMSPGGGTVTGIYMGTSVSNSKGEEEQKGGNLKLTIYGFNTTGTKNNNYENYWMGSYNQTLVETVVQIF